MWFTPTNGLFIAKLNAFPYDNPTNNAPTNPGPYVGVTASISSKVTFASFNANFVTLEIASIWFLEAISGTTPPYFSCIGICVSIIFDNISLPFFTTANEVSSQLDSFSFYIIIYNLNINFPSDNIPLLTQFIAGVIIVPASPVIHINTNTI